MPNFAVNCVGHQGQPFLQEVPALLHPMLGGHGLRSYTEYCFRVRHGSGSEWTFSRRYQDLLDLHERLCAVFGDKDLPPFPPRTSGGALGVLFGQRPGSQPEVVAERVKGFQRYFDGLCERHDVVGTACFQAALAVVQPEPISHLRVQGWLPPAAPGQGLTALLEVRPEAAASDNRAVAETYHVRALLVFAEDSSEAEELCLVSDVRQPAHGRATLTRVEGLKPGAQVEFEVSVANAIGRSATVSIRAMAPQASSEAPAVQAAAHEEATVVDSSQQAAEELKRIQQERQELERWWAEKQREAERADKVREEQMAAFREQREAFDRQLTQQSTGSRCGSPPASPGLSPAVSPRAAEARSLREADELIRAEEDLQRREESLASRAECLAQTESMLQREREALNRQRGSLAVVQAHVVSMIESQQGVETREVRIDDGATPLNAGASSEDLDRRGAVDSVWNMDWVNPFKEERPNEEQEEEDSPQRELWPSASEAAQSSAPPAAAPTAATDE